MRQALKVKYLVDFNLPPPHVLENAEIIVEGNTILEIGKGLDLSECEVSEFPHHVVIPGLINTHSHAAMTLFRGFADDIPLDKWLNENIWPKEAKLNEEMVEIGARLAAVELIKSGTTTMNSMYWYPDGELQAFSETGVRLLAGPPIISGLNSLESNTYLFDKWHGKTDDLVRVALNPHAPYTVTGEEYQKIHEFKESYNQKSSIPILVHTHLAESRIEMDMIREFGKKNNTSINESSPTQYLNQLGVLDNDFIAAHVIECDQQDLNILKQNNVGVAVNPVSNMKLGNGLPKLKEMYDLGLKIGIGTDGPASNNSLDLFETMKMAGLTQKSIHGDPSILPAASILRMATKGGAEVLGWKGIGEIKAGSKADMAIIDLNQPHLSPIINLNSVISHIVYSARGGDVSDVMINGMWKMRDRKILGVDVVELVDKFQNITFDLLNNNS